MNKQTVDYMSQSTSVANWNERRRHLIETNMLMGNRIAQLDQSGLITKVLGRDPIIERKARPAGYPRRRVMPFSE